MNIKLMTKLRFLLTTSVLLLLSLGYTANLSAAGVSATAMVDMTNFQILGSDGEILDAAGANTGSPTGDFVTLTFTGTADSDVSLGAASDTNSGTNPPNNPLDLAPLCLGACPVTANNAFPVISGPPTGTYAATDQNESGAPVANLSGFSDPASVANAGYVGIDTGNTDGSGNTNNNLNANWTFSLPQATGITFEYDVRAYLEAHVSGMEIFPSFATAAYSVRFSLTNLSTGAEVFRWQPNGNGGGISGGVVGSDPFSLATTVSLNAPLPFDVTSTGGHHTLGNASSGTFSATTVALEANTLYQLSARIDVNVDALRVEVPVVAEGCRLTGGGVATDDTTGAIIWDGETLAEAECIEPTGINRYTFGGQVGANTALPPQPKGEWQHNQHEGPGGDFSFHAGTASAPAGTEIIEIRCSDPGGCAPSGNPPSPVKQLDFDCIGTFSNIGGHGRNSQEPIWLIENANATAEGNGNKAFDGTFHYCEVNVDDLGEGPDTDEPNSADCPAEGFGEKGDPTIPANCNCPDFYRITIYDGVNAEDVAFIDGKIDPSTLNRVDVIYEVEGYLGRGGNGLQLHSLTGFDSN